MTDVRQVLFDIHKEIIDGEWGPYDDDHYWPLVDDAMERLGLEEETRWGPVSVPEYHDDGTPVMDERMVIPVHKHRFEWATHRRWVTPFEIVGERETSEELSARLQERA